MNARGARRRTAGVVFLLVPVLLIWLAVSVYQKDFEDSDEITLLTGSVGNELHRGAEVKLRGVVVGEVRRIDATATGARLTLAMRPGALDQVPAGVSAQMLPTTLFGERFVALVPPARPAGRTLAAGAVIPQDRSRSAVELQEVLDNLLPTLTAVQPHKLSATLTAVSRALSGRGGELGTTLTRLDAHLKKFNPQLPALNEDLRQLVKVSAVYADSAPDIVRALDDLTTTSSTLAEQEAALAATYDGTTRMSEDLTAFLRQNKDTIIRLAATGRPTLALLAEYAPSFPCTLRTLAQFVPAMDKALGKGTDRPGLHVSLTTVPSRGAYRPGADTPVYDSGGGPHCYPVPYLKSPVRTPALAEAAGQDLGPANSPQENALVTELLAPTAKKGEQPLPDWSSLLAGPLYRGTEVTVE
ncbi:MCE family protein [Streptomyces sp. SCSIO ZS0520]|uniref:MCE family protein n=1 Tax=Streptomyces sp. SCSIO ZS0520 TaxID=2892996 RepID=UPI0021D902E3|nr:MCE family protein [Streptomyces sp. SCSIO ZS0520]